VDIVDDIFTYNVGYHSYEESEYTQLLHSEEFTEQQLLEWVTEAIIQIMRESGRKRYSKKFEGWYEYLHSRVIDYLVENKGFKELKFQASFSLFGWSSIFTDNWGKQVSDDNMSVIRRAVREAGYTQWDEMNHDSWTENAISECTWEHWKEWY